MKSISAVCVLILSFALAGEAQNFTYSDDFSGAQINQQFWQTGGGSGVVQNSGNLTITRNDLVSDWISSRFEFIGPFVINVDVLSTQRTLYDMFQGISLTTVQNPGLYPQLTYDGVAMGFYEAGTFFSGQSYASSLQQFSYGSTYQDNIWYHLRMVSDGTTVSMYVNDTLEFTRDMSYIGAFYVNLPGFYSSDTPQGAPGQATFDNFSIDGTIAPEPSTYALCAIGGLVFIVARLRNRQCRV